MLVTSKSGQTARKFIIPILASALVFAAPAGTVWKSAGGTWLAPVSHAAAAQQAPVTYKLAVKGKTMVTSGVQQISYAWVPSDAAKTANLLHVLQIDLTNPYVKLDAMGGRGGSVTSKQSVMAMAKENGAVAGVNGDVFGTASSGEGAPLGAQITSGKLVVSTNQLQGMYAFGVTQNNQPVIDRFSFSGVVTAVESGASFALAGVNKSAYITEPDKTNSHSNGLFIYTSAWTGAQRPANSSTTPKEALIVDGIVQEVAEGGKQIETAIPANGYILRGHETKESGRFITNNLTVGSRVEANYQLVSQTTSQSYQESDFQMIVSGHTLLVDDGKAAGFSRDINGVSGYADRARTAVGFSKDGRTAYLVTVEESTDRKGVSLSMLQKILLELGVWKAVNLDGGGSTTMVSRPLGDYQVGLTHPTTYGTTQRLVPNGIGVYTTAPEGALQGIIASGQRTLFIGDQVAYSLKAYDTFYNPVDASGLSASWQVSSDPAIGKMQDGIFHAIRAGTSSLTVTSGTATDTIPIEVIGQAQITKLQAAPSSRLLQEGNVISVPMKAILTDGRTLSVPNAGVTWEFVGFSGSVQDGKLTVGKLKSGVKTGYAIARYDGYGTMIPLTVGQEKVLENFEKVAYKIGFSGLPAQTIGSASVKSGVKGKESSKVLQLTYDFTKGTGSRFAYAILNEGKGITLEGSPGMLTLDVLGDQSMNWLRAQGLDADGKDFYVTIAEKIDWTGWKNLRVDLAALGIKGPAKLTRLYVVNQEKDQDERAMQGEVAFDNLKLQFAGEQVKTTNPTIVMTVGKKEATIDGKAAVLPGAPFVLKGTSSNYLPLRFVADALGAQVTWNNKEKRVTVLRGDRMIELWVNGGDMIVNGERMKQSIAPVIIKESVYVPVRVISEQLGQKVEWKQATKTITIR